MSEAHIFILESLGRVLTSDHSSLALSVGWVALVRMSHDQAASKYRLLLLHGGSCLFALLEVPTHFYPSDRFPGRKGVTGFAVRKGIPHNHVDLPPLVSVEATGVCIRICNSKYCLQLFINF
jgi:hypothetical protein